MGIWSIASGLLLVIIVTDAVWRRIPHPLTIGGMTFAVLTAASWQVAVVGGIVCFSLFWGIQTAGKLRFKRPVLGSGDVMLAGMIGTLEGTVDGLMALAVGMLLAGCFAALGLATGRLKRTDSIPYGVFLALGAFMLIAFPS